MPTTEPHPAGGDWDLDAEEYRHEWELMACPCCVDVHCWFCNALTPLNSGMACTECWKWMEPLCDVEHCRIAILTAGYPNELTRDPWGPGGCASDDWPNYSEWARAFPQKFNTNNTQHEQRGTNQ